MKNLVINPISFVVLIVILFINSATGQKLDTDDKPKMYLDCQRGCDTEYFREEISFINFMRDRQSADVFIQLTELRTGTGGTEYSMSVLGQKRFEGMADTLTFYTDPQTSDNVERTAIVEHIKLALLPFLLQTSYSDKIDYTLDLDGQISEVPGSEDPWNYWVFRVRGHTFFRGEESTKKFNFDSSLSASRTTKESKFRIYGFHEYQHETFKLSDEEDFVSVVTAAGGGLRYIRSITDHWSLGVVGRASESSFSNIDFSARVKPAIEYSYYPYEEATRRQFTFTYAIGPVHNNYSDSTVFDELKETLIQQSLDIGFTQIQNWGSVSIDFSVRNYVKDIDLTRISLNPRLEWNLTRGLNLNIYSRVSYIGDLINISKEDLEDEEILLGITQLDTDFDYWLSIGFSYRIGSSINNVVNTRFNNFNQ